MYFQSKYLQTPATVMQLYKIATELKDKMCAIIKENARYSFYENGQVTNNKLNDESSDPAWNEDLKGYYEIYENMDVIDFVKVILKNHIFCVYILYRVCNKELKN